MYEKNSIVSNNGNRVDRIFLYHKISGEICGSKCKGRTKADNNGRNDAKGRNDKKTGKKTSGKDYYIQ